MLRTMLATRLRDLESVERRKIPALVGLAPCNHDSGQWRGKHRIVGGRVDLRRMLYMASWSAIWIDPEIGKTYPHMVDAGKPRKLTAVACMRKYLIRSNAMQRDNAPWRETPMAA